MGRICKRVPLDFNYPLNKVWEGYVNPHYKECPQCKNGYTNARLRLSALVRLIMLSSSDSLKQENHPYFEQIRMSGISDIVPSPDMIELTEGLSGRKRSWPMGHDSSDSWAAEKKIIEAAGLSDEWGICKHCNGEAIDRKVKEAYEAWQEYDPPTGEGYQLWETTSEGSPTSPVFSSFDELCEWCEGNAFTFASFRASKNEWFEMLSKGFVSHKEGNVIFF